jgi:hypothetical protein
MQTIRTGWNLFLFLSLLTVPQLLGILAYFRIRRFQNLLAHFVGFLIPPSLFFYLAWLFEIYLPSKAHVGNGCGMWAIAALLIVLFGTSAQAACSLAAQLMLHFWHRPSAVPGAKEFHEL